MSELTLAEILKEGEQTCVDSQVNLRAIVAQTESIKIPIILPQKKKEVQPWYRRFFVLLF